MLVPPPCQWWRAARPLTRSGLFQTNVGDWMFRSEGRRPTDAPEGGSLVGMQLADVANLAMLDPVVAIVLIDERGLDSRGTRADHVD